MKEVIAAQSHTDRKSNSHASLISARVTSFLLWWLLWGTSFLPSPYSWSQSYPAVRTIPRYAISPGHPCSWPTGRQWNRSCWPSTRTRHTDVTLLYKPHPSDLPKMYATVSRSSHDEKRYINNKVHTNIYTQTCIHPYIHTNVFRHTHNHTYFRINIQLYTLNIFCKPVTCSIEGNIQLLITSL